MKSKKPRRPNQTRRVTQGLVALADAADNGGPRAVLGHAVRDEEDRDRWLAICSAVRWIRSYQRYEFEKNGIVITAGCDGDT